jgi:hypothetical protein
VHRDAVGTGVLAPAGRLDRIREHTAARLSKRGDVVDVYIEALMTGGAW